MPISYVEMFHPQQMDAVGQILAGGTNALSGAINNSVQLGRDMVNLRAAQEKEYLAERGRVEEMGQRRAEFLTKQGNVDRDFYRNVFSTDREFDYRKEVGDRKFESDIYENDRDYNLRSRDVLSAIAARQNDANYRNAALANQAEANRLRAGTARARAGSYNPALGAWVMGKGEMPGATTTVDDYSSMFSTRPVEAAADPLSLPVTNQGWNEVFNSSTRPAAAVADPLALPVTKQGWENTLPPPTKTVPVAASAIAGIDLPDGVKPEDTVDAIKQKIKVATVLAAKSPDPEEATMLANQAAALTNYAARKDAVEKRSKMVDGIITRSTMARNAKREDKLTELGAAMADLSAFTGTDASLLKKMDYREFQGAVAKTGADLNDERVKKLYDTISEYSRTVKGDAPEEAAAAPVITPGIFADAIRTGFKNMGMDVPSEVLRAAAKAGAAKAAAGADRPSRAEALDIVNGLK